MSVLERTGIPGMDWGPQDSPDAGRADKPRREFLTCRLGGETYGIDILKVQEIREIDHVTRVPRVASFVRGVINLRGAIVPIVDLGLVFGFAQPLPLGEAAQAADEAGRKASAIVLNVDRRLVGVVVEAVSDVIALADDEIEAAPELGGRAVAAAIRGIGAPRDAASGEAAQSVLLLDIDYVLRRVREERA